MSEEEIAEVEADLHGLSTPSDVVETSELLCESRVRLKEELGCIPLEEKNALSRAQSVCPELVDLDSDAVLPFLRYAKFDVVQSAKRLVRYWEARLNVFGEDLAFQPLTLNKAHADDGAALAMGLIQYLPSKDKTKRGILFCDKNRWDRDKCSRKDMVRAFWYIVHACLEDEICQKRGAVFIVYPQQNSFSQYDRKLDSMVANFVWSVIPLKLAALHYCYPPRFMEIVFPMYLYLLGRHSRARLRIHEGNPDKVLLELDSYGLDRKDLPVKLSGSLEFSYSDWLDDRKEQGL